MWEANIKASACCKPFLVPVISGVGWDSLVPKSLHLLHGFVQSGDVVQQSW